METNTKIKTLAAIVYEIMTNRNPYDILHPKRYNMLQDLGKIMNEDECDDQSDDARRTNDEIHAYMDEAFDKVWLMRNCHIPTREAIHDVGKPAVERILNKYDIPPDGYNDWECGYWNGVLGTLRWVMGAEEGLLDT